MPTNDALIARDAELAALSAVLDGLACGRGDAVVIIGAAGMGKSMLLSAVRDRALRLELQLSEVACSESFEHQPLAVASALCEAFGAPVDAGPEGLAEAAIARTPGAGALVLIDDAQWVDAASVPFLLALIGAAMETRFGLVVAMRIPSARAVPAKRLVGSVERRGGRTIQLGPLSEEDSAALAESVSGESLDDERRATLAAAGGNPFLLRELANAWRHGRQPTPEGALSHTLAHLSPEARALLDSASVLGRAAPAVDLAAMSNRPAVTMASEIRELLATGLIIEAGEHLCFRHDLIREEIYGALPSAIRAASHRAAATAMAARGAPVVDFAHHLVEGALPGDAGAAEQLREAARLVAHADVGEATTLVEAARRLCDPNSTAAREIDHRLVTYYAWIGRTADAVELSRKLLQSVTSVEEEARVRAGLAEALARGGDERACGREAEAALSLTGVSPRQRALLLVLAATGKWDSQPERCREFLKEARGLAGDDQRLALPLIEHEVVSYQAELNALEAARVASDGVRTARRAVERSQPLAQAHLAWALMNSAEAAVLSLSFDEALFGLAEAEQWARRAGVVGTYVPETMGLRAEVYVAECRWDDALAEIEARRDLLYDLGLPDASASRAPIRSDSLLARISVLTGDSNAVRHLENWHALPVNAVEAARRSLVAGYHAHLQGDRPGSAEHYSRAVTVVSELQTAGDCAQRAVGRQLSWATPFLALWMSGHRGDAELLAGVMAPVSHRNRSLPQWATAGAVVGAVHDSAGSRLRQAEELAAAIPAPLFRYEALCDIYEAAHALGQRELEGRCEAAAVDLAHAHGLALRPSWAVNVPGRRRRRELTGIGSLTPTERRVARLVAEGLTNAQIAESLLVSRYTVETHLKHAFQKLHIRSRVELATAILLEAPPSARD